jgi:hypothetical protein
VLHLYHTYVGLYPALLNGQPRFPSPRRESRQKDPRKSPFQRKLSERRNKIEKIRKDRIWGKLIRNMFYFGGCPQKSGANVHLNVGPHYFHPFSFKVFAIIYTVFLTGLLYSQITYQHRAGYTFWECWILPSYQDPAATFGQCHPDPIGSPALPLYLNCSWLILLKLPSTKLIYKVS